jgi:hypothetical protein
MAVLVRAVHHANGPPLDEQMAAGWRHIDLTVPKWLTVLRMQSLQRAFTRENLRKEAWGLGRNVKRDRDRGSEVGREVANELAE